MKKKYNITPPENNKAEEAAVEYQRQTKIKLSPPLTEEELKNTLTSEEFWESTLQYIDELFDKK